MLPSIPPAAKQQPPIVELFTKAFRYHQAGHNAEAEPLLRQVLSHDPHHGGALHMLGVLAYQAGRLAQSVELFRSAADADPGNCFFHSSLGAALQAMGQFAEANACHRRTLAMNPRDVSVLNNLGITLVSMNQLEEAVSVFRQAAELSPNDAEVLVNLTGALRAQGRLEEAQAVCQQALRLHPGLAEAHHNLGNILHDQGKTEQALACYQQAMQINPQFVQAHVALGRALQSAGRLDEAIIRYREAIRLRPDNFEAHGSLADALLAKNQAAQALVSWQEALRIRPHAAEAYNGLGNAYYSQGLLDQAVSCFESALHLAPDHAPARYNFGVILQAQGRLSEARDCFRQAMQLQPDNHVTHSTYLGSLIYDPTVDAVTLLAEHRQWARQHAREVANPAPFAQTRDPKRRLRIGYVSPDFRSHAVGYFVQPILAVRDAAQFETYCYAEVSAPDWRTAQLRTMADYWRDTWGVSDDRLAQLIREDQIDILVDLAGHTAGNRLRAFAMRPAPIQVSYLGYPSTTGLSSMDYRLSDEVADPPGEPMGHSEELVRLPTLFCCYAPPANAPDVTPLPALQREYVTFGSLHKLEKLNAEVLDIWSRILRDVPSSRLLLSRNTLHGRTAERLVKQFEQRGVNPARLIIHKSEPVDLRHLRIYEELDIALDPFPWNGHTTACEALWMGVPVIALRGKRHSSRMVASVLTSISLSGFLVETPEEYCRAAANWASNLEVLAEFRKTLRPTMIKSPLCDGRTFVRDLEKSYKEMWRAWCSKEISC